MAVEIPTGKGNFGGCPAHYNPLRVCSGVAYAANESFSPQYTHENATAAADCNTADWTTPHYIVPREKSALLRCGLPSNDKVRQSK